MQMSISKPLLAQSVEKVEDIKYPCLVTPKIDGVRALKIGGVMVSRQLKPIRNEAIRDILSSLLPEGADGEICGKGTFQDVTSMVMTIKAPVQAFQFYWFDFVMNDPTKPYSDRVKDMKAYIREHPDVMSHPVVKLIPLFPEVVSNVEELHAYENKVLEQGFEGVMIRKVDGKYKMGRSTLREGILLKLKRFTDAEAIVIGFQELQHNVNEQEKDALGYNKRSSKKGGMVGGETMGALVVKGEHGEFCIGTGFTAEQRKQIWEEREQTLGKIVKFKYFEVGTKSLPRFPTFLGFRDADDM
jgi:DNA ligase-1